MAEKTLHIDLRVGETLVIGGALVRLEEKSGQRARLRITAPPSMRVDPPTRQESGSAIARRGILSLR